MMLKRIVWPVSLGLVAYLLLTLFFSFNQPLTWAAPSTSSGLAPAAAVVRRERLTITTAGADGSAAGSTTTGSILQGRVVRVDLDYAAGITTTTDLTLADGTALGTVNVVSVADSATDAVLYPTIGLTDNTGTARTNDGTYPVVAYPPVAGKLTASLAQSTAATPALTIDIYWESN
jgi:hypothetical protein